MYRRQRSLIALLLCCCLGVLFTGMSPVYAAKSGQAAPSASPKHKTKAKAKAKKIKATKVLLGKAFGNSAAVKNLAADIALEHGLPAAWVQQQLASARLVPQAQQLILPPSTPTTKNWAAYRARFIEPQRIQAGVSFWHQHANDLMRAEQTYGVPAAYIVGVLGVETFFGELQGQFKVLDVLTTLSLAFPPQHPQAQERAAFFKNELGIHLEKCWKDKTLNNQLGSFAGAIGWPQFMPSSEAKFAVDFDGDGHVNLSKSASDAIGSVANYFRAYGWQTGMPTHFQVEVGAQDQALAALLAPDIVPTWSAAHLAQNKVVLSEAGQQHHGSLALVELFNGNDQPTYVAGTDNFFVVTRYNRSSYYAMAVIELGQAVEQARRDSR